MCSHAIRRSMRIPQTPPNRTISPCLSCLPHVHTFGAEGPHRTRRRSKHTSQTEHSERLFRVRYVWSFFAAELGKGCRSLGPLEIILAAIRTKRWEALVINLWSLSLHIPMESPPEVNKLLQNTPKIQGTLPYPSEVHVYESIHPVRPHLQRSLPKRKRLLSRLVRSSSRTRRKTLRSASPFSLTPTRRGIPSFILARPFVDT
jgi:hypothetical protein